MVDDDHVQVAGRQPTAANLLGPDQQDQCRAEAGERFGEEAHAPAESRRLESGPFSGAGVASEAVGRSGLVAEGLDDADLAEGFGGESGGVALSAALLAGHLPQLP